MKKRIISIILSIALITGLLSMFEVSANADSDQVFSVNNIVYKVLTATATAATVQVGDGVEAAVPTNIQGTLKIPAAVNFAGVKYNVTNIGDWAFCGCTDLTTIVIPNSVESIDYYAFAECPTLSALFFDGAAPDIGENTFADAKTAVETVSQSGTAMVTLEHLLAAPTLLTRVTGINSVMSQLATKLAAVAKKSIASSSVAKLSRTADSATKAISQVLAQDSVSRVISLAAQETNALSLNAKSIIDTDALTKLVQLKTGVDTLTHFETETTKLAQVSQTTIAELIQLMDYPSTKPQLIKAIEDGYTKSTEIAGVVKQLALATDSLSKGAEAPNLSSIMSQLASKVAALSQLKGSSDTVIRIANDTDAITKRAILAATDLIQWETEAGRISKLSNDEISALTAITDGLSQIGTGTNTLSLSARGVMDSNVLARLAQIGSRTDLLSHLQTETTNMSQLAQAMVNAINDLKTGSARLQQMLDASEGLPQMLQVAITSRTKSTNIADIMSQLTSQVHAISFTAQSPSIMDILPRFIDHSAIISQLAPTSGLIAKLVGDRDKLSSSAQSVTAELLQMETELQGMSQLSQSTIEELSQWVKTIGTLSTDEISRIDSLKGRLAELAQAAIQTREKSVLARSETAELAKQTPDLDMLSQLVDKTNIVSQLTESVPKEIKKSEIVSGTLSNFGISTDSLQQLIQLANAGRTKSASASSALQQMLGNLVSANTRAPAVRTVTAEISNSSFISDALSLLVDKISIVSELAKSDEVRQLEITVDEVSQVENAIDEVLPITPGTEAHVYLTAEGFPPEGQQWNGLTIVIRPYLVTFTDWDGTVLDEQEVYHGNAAVAPNDPKRFDHYFIGWDNDFYYVTWNLTVTAQYVGWKKTDKKEASGIKIASNAQSSSAGSGVVFYWDQKQKDDCVLVIAPEFFRTHKSVTIVTNSKNDYRIVTIPVSGTFEVKKWNGNDNINMVWIRFNN